MDADAELEALAREIAAERGCSLRIARQAARALLAELRRVRQDWDRSVARQSLHRVTHRPPTA
jgi:hypothetical protein